MFYKKDCTLIDMRGFKFLIYIIALLTTFEISAAYNTTNQISEKTHFKYNLSTASRIAHWHKLLETAKHLTEHEKLEKVNNFFNSHIMYVSDVDLWGVTDYWATPHEILVKGAGDCEDYSIAKYFTLKKLGIPENKIRITYVKNLRQNQPHMVLTYSSSPDQMPVILDNLIPEITSAEYRTDLTPLYSFNDKGLWLAKFNNNSKRVGNSSQLSMWVTLTHRM